MGIEHEEDLEDDDTIDSGEENEEPEGEESEGEEPESAESEGEKPEEESAEDTDEEREAIRARRREERHRRKEAQRQREETLRNELAARDSVIGELQQRLQNIERRHQSGEVAQIDNALRQAAQAYEFYQTKLREGVDSANGELVVEAQKKMQEANVHFQRLQQHKQLLTRQQQQPRAIDPRVANNAQEWAKRNNWYNPQGTDEDSMVTRAVDDALAAEGYVPSTPEYWKELDRRLIKRLPHRFKEGYTKPRSKSVTGGSGKENASAVSGYKLSAERKQALMDAGMWDDPEKRKAAIKQFQAYDRNNRGE